MQLTNKVEFMDFFMSKWLKSATLWLKCIATGHFFSCLTLDPTTLGVFGVGLANFAMFYILAFYFATTSQIVLTHFMLPSNSQKCIATANFEPSWVVLGYFEGKR